MRHASQKWSLLLVAVLIVCNVGQSNVYATRTDVLARAPLAMGGISGVVTAKETGMPLAGVTVVACEEGLVGFGFCFNLEVVSGSAVTDAKGAYTIANLAINQEDYPYFAVRFVGKGRYVDQWYDHVPYPIFGESRVKLRANQIVPNVNASMEQYARLTGKVTSRDTGHAMPCVNIYVYDTSGNDTLVKSTSTDQAGNFFVDELRTGGLKLQFDTQQSMFPFETLSDAPSNCDETRQHQSEYYNHRATFYLADRVDVTDSVTTTVNVALSRPALITGVVTAKETGIGLSNILIKVFDPQRVTIGSTFTDNNGQYILQSLLPDNYLVCFNLTYTGGLGSRPEYEVKCYKDQPGESLATIISATGIVTNINALLTRKPQVNFVVTAEDTGLPVERALVAADAADGNNYAFTDAQGKGVVTLNPGIYKFRITPPIGRYLSEYFDNQINYTLATSVNLLQPTTTLTLNVQLPRGGVIAGDIINHNTGLAASAYFNIYNADTDEPVGYSTRGDASFISEGLPTGRYKVFFGPVSTYCGRGGCIYEPYIRYYYDKVLTKADAAIIVVTAPLTTSLGTVFMYDRPIWLPPRLFMPLINRY